MQTSIVPSAAFGGAPVVLVTGAAKRLGREIALCLAHAGWRVAVHYNASHQDASKTAAECSMDSRTSVPFQANLALEAEANALVGRVVAGMGQLDAVVNSASLFELDHAADFSYASLNAHLHTNTAAAIVLARDLAKHVATRKPDTFSPGGPCVVNLLDQKLWNPNPDFFSYTLSKAALEAANTLLALALAPAVRVVGVAPGLTLTSHMLSDDAFEQLHKLGPLHRGSNAQDVANTVAFALSNRSMTGTTLLVDAGQHLQRFERDFSLM
jgi:NAD(P)-dependent dehydrogenase (short-subunit alcohol dehydrogenase family)